MSARHAHEPSPEDAERDRLEGHYTQTGSASGSELTVHGEYTRSDGEDHEPDVVGGYTDEDGAKHPASERTGKYTRHDQ